jgi:hypothetical protein
MLPINPSEDAKKNARELSKYVVENVKIPLWLYNRLCNKYGIRNLKRYPFSPAHSVPLKSISNVDLLYFLETLAYEPAIFVQVGGHISLSDSIRILGNYMSRDKREEMKYPLFRQWTTFFALRCNHPRILTKTRRKWNREKDIYCGACYAQIFDKSKEKG